MLGLGFCLNLMAQNTPLPVDYDLDDDNSGPVLRSPHANSGENPDLGSLVDVFDELGEPPVLDLLNQGSVLSTGDSGGMNGAGNGEYITYQQNPWFLGREAVKYCVAHSEENFSLSLERSRQVIKETIKDFFSQIEYRNKYGAYNTYENRFGTQEVSLLYGVYSGILNGDFQKFLEIPRNPTGYEDGDYLLVTTAFEEVACNQAELIISLGDISPAPIQDEINRRGLEEFRNEVVITKRTEYNWLNLRSKGFIYLAADKGAHAYAGFRAPYIKSDTLWNLHEKLVEGIPLPEEFQNQVLLRPHQLQRPNDLKKATLGVLKPILFQEFGHLSGLGNISGTVMDTSFTKRLAIQGLEFKDNYHHYSDFILEATTVGKDITEIYLNIAEGSHEYDDFAAWLKRKGVKSQNIIIKFTPLLNSSNPNNVTSHKGKVEVFEIKGVQNKKLIFSVNNVESSFYFQKKGLMGASSKTYLSESRFRYIINQGNGQVQRAKMTMMNLFTFELNLNLNIKEDMPWVKFTHNPEMYGLSQVEITLFDESDSPFALSFPSPQYGSIQAYPMEVK